jgi:uncharacterized LabA/DUF88 family protein
MPGSIRRTRIFVDYWNFQLSWNSASRGARCDWRALPGAMIGAANQVLAEVGSSDVLELEETLLYASVDPTTDANLRRWLHSFVDRLPGWRVEVRDRRPQSTAIHCRACGHDSDKCPSCGEQYVARVEKGVDAAIVTDLLSLAYQDTLDVAIIVSSDSDFVPPVKRVQERGTKIINAGWRGRGHELKAACWASVDLDTLIPALSRS